MNSFKTIRAAVERLASWYRRATLVLLPVIVWLATSEVALAWAKKKAEPPPETKSYVMPYLIVIVVIAMGLMTVCRPNTPADKLDEKAKKDEDE